MSTSLIRNVVLAAMLGLAGCGTSVLDPTLDPYTWQPEGVNEQNIAAEVARPSDLAAPVGDVATGGAENVAALGRWRASAGRPPGGSGGGATGGAGSSGDTGGLDAGSLSSAGNANAGSSGGATNSVGTP